MQSKFNINCLPDLKIRVNNKEESERAQVAFFALNNKSRWFGYDDSEVMGNLFTPNIIFTSNQSAMPNLLRSTCSAYSSNESKASLCQEITIEELEALANQKKGMKTSKEWAEIGGIEILDPDGWDRQNLAYSFYEELISAEEFNSRLRSSTIQMKPIEMGNMPGMVYNPTNPDTKMAEREAQKRYDAAIKWLEENSSPLYETDSPKFNQYPETNCDVLEAIRIASGLETIKQ